MLSDSPLLSLPTELRHTIYRLVVQDVEILLRPELIPSIQTRSGTRVHKPISSREMLKYVKRADRHKIAILYTSSFCFKDAIEILADNAMICLIGKHPSGEDRKVLAVVDAAFLRRVPAISMSPYCAIGFKHTTMPRLTKIHMMASSTKAWDLDEAVHELFCPRCGDPSGQARYHNYWRSIRGGLQKKDQLRKLAQSQGWDLRFTLSYGFEFPPTPRAKVRMALKYDLLNDRMISKRLLSNGRTVARGFEIRDLEYEDPEDLSLLFS